MCFVIINSVLFNLLVRLAVSLYRSENSAIQKTSTIKTVVVIMIINFSCCLNLYSRDRLSVCNCREDRLSERHSCRNFYPCVGSVSQPVSLAVSPPSLQSTIGWGGGVCGEGMGRRGGSQFWLKREAWVPCCMSMQQKEARIATALAIFYTNSTDAEDLFSAGLERMTPLLPLPPPIASPAPMSPTLSTPTPHHP